MTYILRFSDTTKSNEIVVPDMPPGINTIDTSLSLVGRGYPNYGKKIAENFLHLLENFASALPPENPIEGQLWYDTSNPYNKVLRIMDGTAEATRWPSANGIYQQSVNPKDTISAGLKTGDIWVDTDNNQLKIFNSNNWTTVGPAISNVQGFKTGVETDVIEDTEGATHKVVLTYVDNDVVSITANESFVPRTIIQGFTSLSPGITVSVKNIGLFNGTASSALNLEISGNSYSASNFLRKNDTSGIGQRIIGKVLFSTPSDQAGSQGRDGIVISLETDSASNYVQFYKYGNDALFLNNNSSGKLIFKTSTVSVLTLESNLATINASANVIGQVNILNTLTILSTLSNSVIISGGIKTYKEAVVGGNLLVSGVTTSTGQLTLGSTTGSGPILLASNTGTYDIGTQSMPFRSLYVSYIGSTSTIIYGTLIGSATRLAASTQFILEGQVSAPTFSFSGTGTTATFVTSLSRTAITAQSETTSTTSTLTLLVIDTSTSLTSLSKISKASFLSDVYPPGMITAYGGITAPQGWLLCDGAEYAISVHPGIFSVVGYTYGGIGLTFRVPNWSAVDDNGYSMTYIIKK